MRGLLAIMLAASLVLDGQSQLAPTSSPDAQEIVSARLVGKVTNGNGEPIEGATVLVNRTSGARLEKGLLKSTTDASGAYQLTLRFPNGKTLVVREVFADAKGFVRGAAKSELRLTGGESTNLPFVLKKGESFAGNARVPLSEMERLSGQKAEQIQRMLEISGPALDHMTLNARSFLTEPGGHFECWVPPGEYLVRLHGYESKPVEWLHLQPGRSDLLLELPAFEWTPANLGKVFDDFWAAM